MAKKAPLRPDETMGDGVELTQCPESRPQQAASEKSNPQQIYRSQRGEKSLGEDEGERQQGLISTERLFCVPVVMLSSLPQLRGDGASNLLLVLVRNESKRSKMSCGCGYSMRASEEEGEQHWHSLLQDSPRMKIEERGGGIEKRRRRRERRQRQRRNIASVL